MLTMEKSQMQARLPHRQLVSDELFGRLVRRVVKDHGIAFEEAELIIDGALGFLKLYGDHPDQRFAPSPEIDIGWHTFLVYTRAYQVFCQQIAGRFIHHEPNDDPNRPFDGLNSTKTVAYMEERQIVFNPDLWGGGADACTDGCGTKCGPGGCFDPT